MADKKQLHVVVVQDDHNFIRGFDRLSKVLKDYKCDMKVDAFCNAWDFEVFLEDNENIKNCNPDAFFLDVGEGGASLAKEIENWYKTTRPDVKAPEINFMSAVTTISINEISVMNAKGTELKDISYSSLYELYWTRDILSKMRDPKEPLDEFFKKDDLPPSDSLRKLLNKSFGLNLSLETDLRSCLDALSKLNKVPKKYLLDSWKLGRASTEETLTELEKKSIDIANEVIKPLNAGLVENDLYFYDNCGTAMIGKACFSIADAENMAKGGGKPILIIQSYDPLIVPELKKGYLSGLVVCDTYLASHLKLLCEAETIPGIFGLVPKDDKLKENFNELVNNNKPFLFENKCLEIETKEILTNDNIMISTSDNGLIFDQDKIDKICNFEETNDFSKEKEINYLRDMNLCLDEFMHEKEINSIGIKINLNSATQLENLKNSERYDIGLLRSEQMIAIDEHASKRLKNILLQKEEVKDNPLFDLYMYGSYSYILNIMGEGKNCKIRLLDISPNELLNREEREKFRELYKSLNIESENFSGLKEEIYREQIKTILDIYADKAVFYSEPIKIMLPSVRTEEDVIKYKKIINDYAKELNIDKKDYQFGIMVETLDCAENFDKILPHCEFISFGTNDLTEQVTNIPRWDMKKREKYKKENGIDPYKFLDNRVGEIVKYLVSKTKKFNPEIEIDVCGAHAANHKTAKILHDWDVDNISVPPTPQNLDALPVLIKYDQIKEINKPDMNSKYVLKKITEDLEQIKKTARNNNKNIKHD